MRHKLSHTRFIPLILTLIAFSYPLMLRAAVPTLSINDVTLTEGDSSQSSATFTVTLSPTSANTVTVAYHTASHVSSNANIGTATSATACSATPRPDYLTTKGILAFSPKTSTQTIVVPVCGDTAHEPIETFEVNLSHATNAAIGDSQGLGIIMNNDELINPAFPVTPTVSIAPLQVSEGGSFGSGPSKTVNLTVTLSVQNPAGASVVCTSAETNLPKSSPVQAANGAISCTRGVDFILKKTKITFGPTETSKTCPVTICIDTVHEADESFVVNLSNPLGANIGTGSASVLIQD